MSNYKKLGARCHHLLDTMANDPDRPAWEIELVRITMESLSTAAIINQQHKKTTKSYAQLLTKVESLECRYSELLLKISELKQPQ